MKVSSIVDIPHLRYAQNGMDELAKKKVQSLIVTVWCEYSPRDNGTNYTGSKSFSSGFSPLLPRISNRLVVERKDFYGEML